MLAGVLAVSGLVAAPPAGASPTALVGGVAVRAAKNSFEGGSVTISGPAKVGQKLKARVTGVFPKPSAVTYQWYRSGKRIKGATSTSYRLSAADAGRVIRVKATLTKDGYRERTLEETARVAEGRFTVGKLSYSGRRQVGSTLTVHRPSVSPRPTRIQYQWVRDGNNIRGATSKRYTLTAQDMNTKVWVRATVSRSGYQDKARQSWKGGVIDPLEFRGGSATVVNNPMVGLYVKAQPAQFDPAPSKYSYQWLRGGRAIDGATNKTYRLAADDKGRRITVRVRAERAGYRASSVTSAPVTVQSTYSLDVLASIPIKPRDTGGTYSRSSFGDSMWWDLDGTGCTTRQKILHRDLQNVVLRSNGCSVESGVLFDPYSGVTIHHTAGAKTASGANVVQIDHVVPVYQAWMTGARTWTQQKRERFNQDPANLRATSAAMNEAKGGQRADQWMPPRKSAHCEYVGIQTAVKEEYGLWMPQAEHEFIARILAGCPADTVKMIQKPLPGAPY
jgi:hypothetical protein